MVISKLLRAGWRHCHLDLAEDKSTRGWSRLAQWVSLSSSASPMTWFWRAWLPSPTHGRKSLAVQISRVWRNPMRPLAEYGNSG